MRRLLVTSIPLIIIGLVWVAVPEIKLRAALRGTDKPNPDHPNIVMLGDSHTSFVDWRTLMGCESIANFGVGGDTSVQMLARLPQVIEAEPRVVFIMAGTNDGRRYVDPAMTKASLQTIERELTARQIAVVFLAPPPLPSRRNEMSAIPNAAALNIHFTESDLRDDQIHLRRSGYAKWRDAIAPIVKRYCT